MNRQRQHQQTEKAKSSRLRSALGLLLLAVYALGNFVFSQSALCVFGQMTGQHEVLVRGDQVILHHPDETPSPHRLGTQLLVAISHTNTAGDHELPCAPLVIADPEPNLQTSFNFTFCADLDDDPPAFEHHVLDHTQELDYRKVTQGSGQIAEDAMIMQWRTVKRMV
jgi:hypothetical protein